MKKIHYYIKKIRETACGGKLSAMSGFYCATAWVDNWNKVTCEQCLTRRRKK